ncbi:hypothetical protein [Rhizobium multihospitium]|uniref:hypothetical protein n=1 Tax=Rhizobium multihospitium TaxID=410764 RepID=UPI00114CC76A|nr:hypothetical protein [Rhizobium multihospitium]
MSTAVDAADVLLQIRHAARITTSFAAIEICRICAEAWDIAARKNLMLGSTADCPLYMPVCNIVRY